MTPEERGFYRGVLAASTTIANHLNTFETREVSKSKIYHYVMSLRAKGFKVVNASYYP